MKENVVLTNENDQPLGLMEKIKAHQQGVLHRAFSVFLFDDDGNMLLQQRSRSKYHSPLLWTNSCCSHPRDGESYLNGAQRRVEEELGIIGVHLEERFHFIYKTDVGQGLWEHEFDRVFTGNFNGICPFNTDEVENIRWMSPKNLALALDEKPETFTPWFHIIWREYKNYLPFGEI